MGDVSTHTRTGSAGTKRPRRWRHRPYAVTSRTFKLDSSLLSELRVRAGVLGIGQTEAVERAINEWLIRSWKEGLPKLHTSDISAD